MDGADQDGPDQDARPEPQATTERPKTAKVPTRTMTVAVTGATGFVGRHVCRGLAERGHDIRALVRQTNQKGVLPNGTEMIQGDIFDRGALDTLLDGAEACIHLIGIIFENPQRGITFEHLHVDATRSIVDACEAAGVVRYAHMSALGAREDAPADYHATKFAAEEIVRASRLPWTIFRPSLIHGPDGEFTDMIANWARGKAPPFMFMPYFGAGPLGTGRKRLIQPVYVEDVVDAFCESLQRPDTVNEVFPVGGGDQMTWPEMLTRFRDAIPGAASWRPAMPIPAWYADGVARTMAALGLQKLVPFNHDQVMMSQEDSVCDTARMSTALGVEPTPFDAALSQYVARL